MITFYPNMVFPDVSSWRNMKNQALQIKTVILHKNLESAEFTDNKHGKPTLPLIQQQKIDQSESFLPNKSYHLQTFVFQCARKRGS